MSVRVAVECAWIILRSHFGPPDSGRRGAPGFFPEDPSGLSGSAAVPRARVSELVVPRVGAPRVRAAGRAAGGLGQRVLLCLPLGVSTNAVDRPGTSVGQRLHVDRVQERRKRGIVGAAQAGRADPLADLSGGGVLRDLVTRLGTAGRDQRTRKCQKTD